MLSGSAGVRSVGIEPSPRIAAFAVAASLAICSVAVGKFIAEGSVRVLSLVLLAFFVLVGMHLRPRTLLALTLVVAPLPLYMQGVGASLTPALIAGLIVAAVANRQSLRQIRPYPVLLLALLVAALVSFARGSANETTADVSAIARMAVGVGLFVLCLSLLRTHSDVASAFRALAVGGLVMFGLTAMALVAPSVSVPGMRGGAATVNVGEGGITENLRIGGPIGDYELLAEFFALVGTIALFLATRERTRRAVWYASYASAIVGVALTSTRSGIVLLLAGSLIAVASASRGARRRYVLAAAVLILATTATLPMLQARFGSGYVLERLAQTPFEGGLGRTLNRGGVWEVFLAQLPEFPDLVLGSGPAFNYAVYGSYPHSLALTFAFSLGLAGMAAFAALLSTIVVSCLRRWRQDASPYALLGAAVVVLFVVNETKIEFVRTSNYEWFVWGLLGVCAAAGRART